MWPDAADARRRRRRRRKAQVTPVVVVPGAATTVLNITNPDDTDDLIISGLEVLGRRGKVIDTIDLEPDVEIAPGETEIVPVLIIATSEPRPGLTANVRFTSDLRS
jgi:hypothetical protein